MSPSVLCEIPDHEIESLARSLLPFLIEYFESIEGQAEFEQWKRENLQNKEKAVK